MGEGGQQSWLSKATTVVRASISLSSGAVGSTTFGLWASCLAAVAICAFFIFAGYPQYALAALLIIAIWYLLYQRFTWTGVKNSPDAGVAGEHAYAQVVHTRQGGTHSLPHDDAAPVTGGAQQVIITPSKQGENK